MFPKLLFRPRESISVGTSARGNTTSNFARRHPKAAWLALDVGPANLDGLFHRSRHRLPGRQRSDRVGASQGRDNCEVPILESRRALFPRRLLRPWRSGKQVSPRIFLPRPTTSEWRSFRRRSLRQPQSCRNKSLMPKPDPGPPVRQRTPCDFPPGRRAYPSRPEQFDP